MPQECRTSSVALSCCRLTVGSGQLRPLLLLRLDNLTIGRRREMGARTQRLSRAATGNITQ